MPSYAAAVYIDILVVCQLALWYLTGYEVCSMLTPTGLAVLNATLHDDGQVVE